MFSSLCAAGICVSLASKYGLPVSTTHAIIGAIVGFSLIEAKDGVLWSKIGFVCASWVVSPLLAGGLAASLFYVTKRWVMLAAEHRQLPRQRILVSCIAAFIVALFVIFIGYKVCHSVTYLVSSQSAGCSRHYPRPDAIVRHTRLCAYGLIDLLVHCSSCTSCFEVWCVSTCDISQVCRRRRHRRRVNCRHTSVNWHPGSGHPPTCRGV